MLRSINSLVGFTIGATDGEIGKVEEFYFDDSTWTVRYMIVKTGGWLTGRKVLISPEAISEPRWDEKILSVNLTKKQVEDSPDIDTDKPISRKHEEELFSYYPWQNYYDGGFYGEGIGMLGAFPMLPIADVSTPGEEIKKEKDIEAETHLRSTHELKGYIIHASDGEIGRVADFIFYEQAWNIIFIVVDTGNWFAGKKVLISPAWIKDVKWNIREVVVNVTIGAVKNSPEYNASKLLEVDYAKSLHDHYGRTF